MFSSIFGSDAVITAANAVICGAVSLVLGFVLALVNQRTDERSTKSMFLTVCATPLIVQAVIMLVNGNLGTGVAVYKHYYRLNRKRQQRRRYRKSL